MHFELKPRLQEVLNLLFILAMIHIALHNPPVFLQRFSVNRYNQKLITEDFVKTWMKSDH